MNKKREIIYFKKYFSEKFYWLNVKVINIIIIIRFFMDLQVRKFKAIESNHDYVAGLYTS